MTLPTRPCSDPVLEKKVRGLIKTIYSTELKDADEKSDYINLTCSLESGEQWGVVRKLEKTGRLGKPMEEVSSFISRRGSSLPLRKRGRDMLEKIALSLTTGERVRFGPYSDLIKGSVSMVLTDIGVIDGDRLIHLELSGGTDTADKASD